MAKTMDKMKKLAETPSMDEINTLDNDSILNEFELRLLKGAGRLSYPLIWIRQEIKRRLQSYERIQIQDNKGH